MLETLEQRENAMRDVLRKIESKTDFKEFSDNEKKLAKECYDANCLRALCWSKWSADGSLQNTGMSQD